jgi:predicted HTH domain antitoxin
MAAMDRATFDQLLIERRIPAYDEERWSEDLETLRGIRHP